MKIVIRNLFTLMFFCLAPIVAIADAPTDLYASVVTDSAIDSTNAFLASWREYCDVGDKRGRLEALAVSAAHLRDAYAVALFHKVELPYPYEAGLAKAFSDLNELVAARQDPATGSIRQLPISEIVTVLARGLIAGIASATEGVDVAPPEADASASE